MKVRDRITHNLTLCVLLFLSAGFVLIGCNEGSSSSTSQRTDIPFTPTGLLELVDAEGSVITSVAIEIARGDSARARGLMDRTSLPNRGGMLFFDESERDQTFWMKNTLIPLDIIFIDADSQVVNVGKNTRPLSEDRVSSTAPAQYVLEVKAGFADTYGIDSTTSVRWRLIDN